MALFKRILIVIIILISMFLLDYCKNMDMQNKSAQRSGIAANNLPYPIKKKDTLRTGEFLSVLDKDKNLTDNIKILSRWEFEKYENEAGKVIGFWPECCGNKKFAFINEYNKKWGFNGIVVLAKKQSVDMALRNGFTKDGILAALPKDKSVEEIKKIIDVVDVKFYYIDEPLEDDVFTPGELIKISKYLKFKRKNSFLIMASYHSPSWFYSFLPPVTYGSAYSKVLKNTKNVQIMCDQYDGNQTSDWRKFLESYGTQKIFGHFIHSKNDSSQYSTLLDQKNFPFNVKRIFYFHGASGAPYKTADFCRIAWQKGWLKKYERKVLYYLKCIDENRNCINPQAKWEVVKIIKTKKFRVAHRASD